MYSYTYAAEEASLNKLRYIYVLVYPKYEEEALTSPSSYLGGW